VEFSRLKDEKMIDRKTAQILRISMESLMKVLDADSYYAAFFNQELLIYETLSLDNDEKLTINLPPEIPQDSLPYEVILSKKTRLYENDFGDEIEKLSFRYWPGNAHPKSWIGAPIVSRNRSIGILVVENSAKSNAFGSDGIRFITAVANETAVSIENHQYHLELETLNTELEDRVKERTKQLEKQNRAQQAVHDIGVKLTGGIHLGEKDIARLIKKHADRVMDTDNMYIALYDPDPSDVFDQENPEKCKIHGRIRFELMYVNGKQATMEPRQALPGQYDRAEVILATRKPILIQTKEEALKWYLDPTHKDFLGESLAAWVGVPMVTGGRVIGVIATYDEKKENLYDKNDQQVLSMMAAQAAAAIENARLYNQLENLNDELENRVKERTKQLEKQNEAQQAVHDIGIKLTEGIQLGEKEIARLIKEHADRVMDTNNMYIALYDPDPSDVFNPDNPENGKVYGRIRFELMHVDGKPTSIEPRSAIPGQYGRTEVILATRKPILIKTKEEAINWYLAHGHKDFLNESLAAWVGVPMVTGGKVVGVIATYDKEKEKVYDEDDQQLLSMMAAQAAVAVENARLYYNIEKRTQELKALHDISVQITAKIELKDVISSVVDYANILFKSDVSTLFIYDPSSKQFWMSIRKGAITDEPSYPSINGSTAYIAKQKEPVFVEDVQNNENLKTKKINGKKIKSTAGIPLIYKGRPVGVLYLNYFRYHYFTEIEKEVITALSNQASVAIENAMLYEDLDGRVKERTERLKALHHISIKTTSILNIEEAIKLIVHYTNELLSADFSTIFTYSEENGRFLTGVRKGQVQNTPQLPSEKGFSSKIAINKKAVYWEGDETQIPYNHSIDVVDNQKIYSFAAFPLTIRDKATDREKTVGLMYVNFLSAHSFLEDEKEILEMLANQAAVLIENATLYQKEKNAKAIIANRERSLIMSTIAMDFIHTINNLAGPISPWVTLIKRKLRVDNYSNRAVFNYLEKIVRDSNEILKEAEQMRTPQIDVEYIDIIDLVGSIIGQIELIASPSIDISFRHDEEIQKIPGNKRLISTAIYSIIHNATKAIEGEGNIDIQITRQIYDLNNTKPPINITIIDDGHGIDNSIKSDIFEFGTTYWPDNSGTGYGLWRARNIIQSMDGDIQLEFSEIGHGSKFIIILPAE
jgi:GAF domain-containing protein